MSNPAISIVSAVRSSLSLSIASVGALLVVIGYLLQHGVWPALLAIWGTFLIMFGLCWYAIVLYLYT